MEPGLEIVREWAMRLSGRRVFQTERALSAQVFELRVYWRDIKEASVLDQNGWGRE